MDPRSNIPIAGGKLQCHSWSEIRYTHLCMKGDRISDNAVTASSVS